MRRNKWRLLLRAKLYGVREGFCPEGVAMEWDCSGGEEFVGDYEKRVLGVMVGVRLTPVSELRAELEATGWCGVNLEGAVCVAYLEPDAAELVGESMLEEAEPGSPAQHLAWRYPELAVACEVLGEASAPRSVTGEASTMVLGEAFLLVAFPLDAPEELVRQIGREEVR